MTYVLPTIWCLQETHFEDTHRLKVKVWKQIFHANQKTKAGVAILISDKIYYLVGFKPKTVKRDKEVHCIMIKKTIQEDIAIVNIYITTSEHIHINL